MPFALTGEKRFLLKKIRKNDNGKIHLKRIEWVLGIGLVKRGVFELKMSLFDKKYLKTNGFSLILQNKLNSKK